MHRHFFVRPAGLLGFAALRKPSSPAMAAEGGEGDGDADNREGFHLYQMKTSLGSFEYLRRDAIRNRPSWQKGEAKSPSMAEERIRGRPSWFLLRSKGWAKSPSMAEKEKEKEGFNSEARNPSMAESPSMAEKDEEGERLPCLKASMNVQEKLDVFKGVVSWQESLMSELKSRGFGGPEIWRPYEEGVRRRREITQTFEGYLDEFRDIEDRIEAVITEQMKTSPESSSYHDLEQRKEDFGKQQRLSRANHARMLREVHRVYSDTWAQMH